VLGSVEEISGAKRKQNLLEHADDARMSKQLATLQYDIDTGVDLAAAMASEPDRGALRDFMREFELRAVMERLEEALPEGEAVPGRSVETELAVEVEDGQPSDLGEGPAALAIAGERWAAAQGERIVAGSATLDQLAVALVGSPLAAHDAKSLGGGRHGLLAAAAREGVALTLDHDTLLAAYLLEPQRRTYELTELAADAGIGLAAGVASGQAGDDAQLALGEEVEAGLDRPRKRAWSPRSPRRNGHDSSNSSWSRCCTTSSCRWSTFSPRWSARA
jgi:DNA polymerase-1